MTSPTDLQALLERAEAATGPYRELDRQLAVTAGGWTRAWSEDGAAHGDGWYWKDVIADYSATHEDDDHPPRYTASVDAALALAERALPGMLIHLGDLDPTDMRAVATLSHGYPDRPTFRGFAPHRQYALAVCRALLRAKISEMNT